MTPFYLWTVVRPLLEVKRLTKVRKIMNETEFSTKNNFTKFLEHLFFNPNFYEIHEDRWILFGLTIPIFVGLGLILNGLIIFVYLNEKLKTSLNTLICSLAFYDIGALLMGFWIFSIPTLFQHFG